MYSMFINTRKLNMRCFVSFGEPLLIKFINYLHTSHYPQGHSPQMYHVFLCCIPFKSFIITVRGYFEIANGKVPVVPSMTEKGKLPMIKQTSNQQTKSTGTLGTCWKPVRTIFSPGDAEGTEHVHSSGASDLAPSLLLYWPLT